MKALVFTFIIMIFLKRNIFADYKKLKRDFSYMRLCVS